MHTGEPENPVAAQSKKLEASAQEEPMMQPSPRLKAWTLPGECLVWVHVEKLKKLESVVHGPLQ
jgi:hypothetical protein